MTYIAKFKCDNSVLDVSENGAISLGLDFIPPGLSPEFNVATGTSANATGGGALISTKYKDRDWTFSLKLVATNEEYALVLARRVVAFLSKSGTKTFEWSGTGLPVPLWGQIGAPLSYEIIAANVGIDQMYALNPRRNEYNLPLTLRVKPFAYGPKQRLASALGGIWADTIGAADGQDWGLRIMEASTNKMTNPAFTPTYITEWNYNWTAGANIIAVENTDLRYCLASSTSSAKLTSKASTTNTYTQSITAGNTNKHSFSIIVARPDGGAVDSNDCVIYYGSAQSTTWRALGNGLYLGYTDNIDGVNSATATGVQVKIGRSVILVAMQMEEKAYHTPITFGDMLGVAWSGTIAESTSARAAGRVRIPVAADTFANNLWAIHFIWKPDYASTAAGDRYLFSGGSTNVRMTFTAADDKVNLLDNTNTASTAAVSFSAGDVLEVLASAGNAGLAVYVKNHTTGNTYSGTNATYTIPASPTYIYIGTDDSAANHAGGIFQAFEIYNDDLTSAQNTALQTALGPVCTAGLKAGDIPLFWNKDGDNVLDNCDDSTNDNWGVVLGVPGNIAADTEWTITPSVVNKAGYWLIKKDMPQGVFVTPTRVGYVDDLSGTADATCSGGEYAAYSSVTAKASVNNLSLTHPHLWDSGKIHCFARMKRSSGATSVKAYPGWYFASTTYVAEAPAKTITIGSSFLWYYLGSVEMNVNKNLDKNKLKMGTILSLEAASATVVLSDFRLFINGYAGYIINSAIAASGSIYVRGQTAIMLDGTLNQYSFGEYRGDVINLEANRTNIIWFVSAGDGEAHTIGDNGTMTRINITPRWSLL